jgi:hypothetical protein
MECPALRTNAMSAQVHSTPHDSETTTSPTAAEYRGSGPRTVAGGVGTAAVAVVLVAAVLAPLVAAVVAATALVGGGVVGAAR